ncbi:hypothetical protein ANO14919_115670 [Xylariales sp. No.14919]|nr:hypothetical protein ANO14919_115670 [Xylariales sp. No.14919]
MCQRINVSFACGNRRVWYKRCHIWNGPAGQYQGSPNCNYHNPQDLPQEEYCDWWCAIPDCRACLEHERERESERERLIQLQEQRRLGFKRGRGG